MISSTAVCHGAASIVNAIATGKGAAFGLDLKTKVTVELTEDPGIDAADVKEPDLVCSCVKKTLGKYPYDYGAHITVESEIPIAKGLKSSSVVANATVLATLGALAKRHGRIRSMRIDKELSIQQLIIAEELVKDETVLDIGISAAKEAGVTITGALDDSAAAYFGGFAVTDNRNNKIMRKGELETLDAIIFVPEADCYTRDFDVDSSKRFAREVDAIWDLALRGDLYTAMTLNGLVYSTALGVSSEMITAAFEAGALCAGLSGTGPAIVALTRKDADAILSAWDAYDGHLIHTKTNNQKAKVVG